MNNVVIAFCLYGQDNDSYMLEDLSSTDLCPKCGYLNQFDYHNPFFKIKKKSHDFSHPYDLGNVVSLKFKEFCVRENYINISFKEFEKSHGYFQFFVHNIVHFDYGRSDTKFKNYCKLCGNYEEVTGVTPPFLKNLAALNDGFYRTDLIFGSGNHKNPITIVAPGTQAKLKKEKMRGLVFKPIYL
jgi:hypothetical protein